MALRASTSQHVYFDESFGSLSCYLDCLAGDVVQSYADPNNWIDDSNYTPQFNNGNFRILELFLNATGAAASELRVSMPTWTYNGESCANKPDYFEPIITGDNSRAQLKIKGNVGKLSQNQNVMIRCNARVGTPDSLVTTQVEGSYNIKLHQQVKDTYRCSIAAQNTQSNFTIGAEGSPIGLQCIVYDWQGNEVSDPGLSYAWAKRITQDNQFVWRPLGDGSAILSVGPDDVDNQAVIRVVVSLNGSVICTDTQTVYDAHDPVQIVLRFDPSDKTVRRNGSVANPVNIYVDCQRSDGTRCSSADLTFVLLDTVGNEVQDVEGRNWQNIKWTSAANPESGKINYNSVAFTITVDDFINGGKDLIVHCEGDLNY